MKKGCTGLLRSSAGLEGPADPLVGPLGPVLGMLLGAGLLVSCVMMGERSQVSFLLVLLRDLPPHLFLYLFFIQQKNKRWKQSRTLPVANTGESKILLNKYLKSLILFLLFILFYYFMFFYHGKLGMLG